MTLEGVHRLAHERHTIGQEQDALRPIGPHQQIGERDHRPRLAGAGRHHQQRLALVVLFDGLRDSADRAGLIEALDDRSVDILRGE